MSNADEKVLATARERFELASTATNKQREREKEAIGFYNGHQWSKELLDSRKGQSIGNGSNTQTTPARPSLVINKTREPVRQVLNQERESDLSIEIVPADDFAGLSEPIDSGEIELREGFLRRIQRDQECEDARSWAFNRAVIAGKGYRVVMTRYVPGKSQDQEVYIERIYDQNSVLIDPSHVQPDGSDAEWEFWGTDMFLSAFLGEYGDKTKLKTISNSDDTWRTLGEQAPGWFTGEGDQKSLRVMNYCYVEHEPKEVYHLSNGAGAYADELDSLPPGVTVLTDEDTGKPQCHTDDVRTVKWCKITGSEILEETTWPSRWLPLIEEVGEELQPYEGERYSEGVVQPMMDSCKGNNYIVSKFVEQVGLTPIPPWMMAAGQDEGFQDEYMASTTRTLPVLHYNQVDDNDRQAPPPARTNVSTDVAAIATGVQIFGQAIAATSVVPQTALGHVDPSVKSGKLAQALIQQGNQGTSNFMDNHVRSMRHEMRVVNDLLYPIYGRPGRLARIVNKQGEQESVIVGQPFVMQGEGPQARPMPVNGQAPADGKQAKTLKLTKDADFNIALVVKRKAETRNREIAEILGGVISADPQQMTIIGDLFWKVLDMPDHEKLAERYKAVLDPRVLAVINGEQAPDPKTQAQLAELTQQNQALQQLADKNRTDLEKVKLQEVAESERRRAELDSEDERNRQNNETKLAVAEISALAKQLQQTISIFAEERARLGVQQEAETSRAHEVGMAGMQHQQGLEAGQQGHQQSLEAQEQQAALQPPPDVTE